MLDFIVCYLQRYILYIDLWHGTPFSLACLVADGNLSERGPARFIGGGFKKNSFIILLFYCIWEYYCCLLKWGSNCWAVLYRPYHLGVSFLRGSCWLEGIVRVNVRIVCDTLLTSQKDALDNLRTPVWYVPTRRRPPNFQPSLGRVYLSIYVCGSLHTCVYRVEVRPRPCLTNH